MKKSVLKIYGCFLALSFLFSCGGSTDDPITDPTIEPVYNRTGVFILNEGNYNAGNASLSYYNPDSKEVNNGIFYSINGRKLGDVAQSITLQNDKLWIAVENSGIIWAIDANTFKVTGQVEANDRDGCTDNHMDHPRYVHFVNSSKAYVTDLYSPYLTVFDPSRTVTHEKSGTLYPKTAFIPTGQQVVNGNASTEEMVQVGNYVFTNCWSYNNKILVIDTATDKVVKEIELSTYQPKAMALDANGKLWVVTDGGYSVGGESYMNQLPHLYRINTQTFQVEHEEALDLDESNVQLCTNASKTVLYIMNNDIYQMNINDSFVPLTPFIQAPVDSNGKRHKLYSIGVNPANDEIYVGDAVDYSQTGVVYRYDKNGSLLDQFRVGITPNHFCFK